MTTNKQNDWVYVPFNLKACLGRAMDANWRSVDEAKRLFDDAFTAAKVAGVQRVNLYVEAFYVEQQRQFTDEEQAEWEKKQRERQESAAKDRIAQLEAELAKLKGGGQ